MTEQFGVSAAADARLVAAQAVITVPDVLAMAERIFLERFAGPDTIIAASVAIAAMKEAHKEVVALCCQGDLDQYESPSTQSHG